MSGFDVKVVDLEGFSPESLSAITSEQLAVFLMATYGEGEPTDNAVSFYKFITNKDEPPTLPNLLYTVFGLGNKQYEHFNRMGKLTDRKLQELGASRVFDYGEGDDDANLEEDFDQWKAKMWAALQKKYNTYVSIPPMHTSHIISDLPHPSCVHVVHIFMHIYIHTYVYMLTK